MSDCLETSAETKFYKWKALLLKDYLALEQETAELFINEVLLSKEKGLKTTRDSFFTVFSNQSF